MMNFDFNNLYLVNPCKFDDECYSRAVHASSILDKAKIFQSFEDAVKNIDFLVATSSKETISEKKHLRNPLILQEFSKKIYEIDGKVGLIFGREDYGLLNDEIAKSDLMLKIQTSDKYKALNLSHSVGLVLYSLFLQKIVKPEKRRTIDNLEKKHLYNVFSDLLDSIDYPEHKNEKTQVMFKRIMSRAMPSKWEYHTLMGVLKKANGKIKKRDKKR
jgi:TrmH family RNA methyltransferase